MRHLVSLARAGLLALAASSAIAEAQCDLVWAASDPSPYLTGTITNMVTWDPDGAGPLTARLVVGSRNGVSGGNFTGAYLAMFDGTDWTELPMADPVERIGVVQGLLVVATKHEGLINPTTPYYYNDVHVRTLSGISTKCRLVMGPIEAIAEYNGDMIIGGKFADIGSSQFLRIARIPMSGVPTPAALGSGIGSGPGGPNATTTVSALAVFNGRLIAGGNFTTAGGSAAAHLAAWNGTAWGPLGNPNAPVRALAVRNATTLNNTFLFAGGDFTAIGPLPMVGVARFNDASNSWTAMSLPGTNQARDLAVRGVGLTGYELHAVSTAPSPASLVRWTGSGWTGLANTNGNLRLGFLGGQLHGGFTSFNSGQEPRWRRVGRLDATAFEPLAGRGIAGTVQAALPDGNDFVIGGDFKTISGTTVNGIARGRPGAWQPLGTGVEGGAVRALARLPNGDLVVGGDFTTAGGQPAAGLARWNGASWSPFGGGGAVHALTVLANGDLVVGGAFATMGGTAAANIARWNGSSWSALGLGVGGGAAPTVHCCRELANGDLVVGGSFTSAGGASANRIARWNGSQWAAYGTGFTFSSQFVRNVEPLASGELLAVVGAPPASYVWGGVAWLNTYPSGFTTLLPNGGVAAASVGAVNVRNTPPDGTSTGFSTWSIEATTIGGVRVATNGDIAIYGDLWAHGPRHTSTPAEAPDTGCSGFVLLQPTCRAQVTSLPSGCTGGPAPAFVAQALPWLGGTYRARATGLAANALAFEVLGLQPANLLLSALAPQGVAGCTLLTTADAAHLRLPVAGTLDVQLALPATVALVGLTIRHQIVQTEFGPGGALGSLSASNLLLPRLGTY
jgi:hypothetical protein